MEDYSESYDRDETKWVSLEDHEAELVRQKEGVRKEVLWHIEHFRKYINDEVLK